mgnify:CR=1 FL=1
MPFSNSYFQRLIVVSPAAVIIPLLAGWVAGQAVAKIGNPLLAVLAGDGILIMAAVAGPTVQRGGMAGAAGARTAVIEGEGVRSVVRRRPPGVGVVTGGTGLPPEQAGMESRFAVAAAALAGRAFKSIVDVTV